MKVMEFSDREIDVILRGLTFALDMADSYFAFHPGQDYNEGDDSKDEDARKIAEALCECLGDG